MLSSRCITRAALTLPPDAPLESVLPFLSQTRTIQRAFASTQSDARPRTITRRRRATNDGQVPPRESAVRSSAGRFDVKLGAEGSKEWMREKIRADDGHAGIRRRRAAPRTTEFRDGYLPFEDGTQGSSILDRVDRGTMTPRELEIFEELLRKGAQVKQPQKEPASRRKTSDQGYRPDSKRYGASAQDRPGAKFPEAIRHLAEESAELRQKATAVDTSAEEYQASVKSIMDLASTDADAWRILEDHVFQTLRAIGLDSKDQAARDEEKTRDLQLLTNTLPDLLLHVMRLMDNRFPSSPYGLAVIPALRKIGPSAFTLGATTDLFNEHMRIIYRQYSDVDAVVEVLSEMDKEVYDYNADTKDIIQSIFTHANVAARGHLGPGLQAFWSTDRKTRSLEKLKRWVGTIESRIYEAEVRRAMSKAADGLVGDEEEEEDDDDDVSERLAIADSANSV
ncbi:Hypothetical predicted protein [Lecanosticta acicola]|uniref:Mtf2-like C-terminal domain-containing protein n=1 Tax=Lecanosticta acicola TaxID=111012 RepID=A0AAI9EFM5_9PEZI|nr:Hypothetical predicted protein [Lecanosticta acicola]